jgi:hypothetical protein
MFEEVFDSQPGDGAIRKGEIPAAIPCDNSRTQYIKIQVDKARQGMRTASYVGADLSHFLNPFESPLTRRQYRVFQADFSAVDLGSQLVKQEPGNRQTRN